MKEQLENIKNSAAQELSGVNSKEQLEAFRVRFLGKKGLLTDVLKGMGKLSAEERPVIGQIANEVRGFIEGEISALQEKIHREELERKLAAETIDVTMPGKTFESGRPHPLTIVLDQLKNIFLGMGFSIAEGPEIELDYYNFEALNLPKDHPARDTQDTFYITENVLLRTQTSPVQIRTMEKQKPPIRVIAPGRVFRSDNIDATRFCGVPPD